MTIIYLFILHNLFSKAWLSVKSFGKVFNIILSHSSLNIIGLIKFIFSSKVKSAFESINFLVLAFEIILSKSSEQKLYFDFSLSNNSSFLLTLSSSKST